MPGAYRLDIHNNKLESEPVLLRQFIRGPLAAFAFVSLSLIGASTIVGQIRLDASTQTKQMVSGENEVALTVTVTNHKGGYIAGLKKESFTVLINNTPQEISRVTREDVPVSVGILIDTSGSIGKTSKRLGVKRLSAIRDGLAHFISQGNKENEYFLLRFADQPELLLDSTRDGSAIPDRVASLQLKGTTALYDACYMGVEKVARGTHRKRAIILVSDGMDGKSKRGSKQLERLLKETDVLVYCISVIGIREDLFQHVDEYDMLGSPILIQFARYTGGLAFFPSESTQLKAMFDLIALDLQNQYTVVVRPKLSGRSDKWHSLKMKVTPPASAAAELGRLIVRSREGFYPSEGLR